MWIARLNNKGILNQRIMCQNLVLITTEWFHGFKLNGIWFQAIVVYFMASSFHDYGIHFVKEWNSFEICAQHK